MTDTLNVADTINSDDLIRVKNDHHLVTAISILTFAYGFQFMVFPSYVELEKRSTERMSWASLWATLMFTFAFTSTGIIGILMFGPEI